jgi:methyl-accepting chemotaxis protein
MRRTQNSWPNNSFNSTDNPQSKSHAEETAKAVKNAAKAIRDAAISTREAIKAFSDSGVVTELAESIQAAAKAARDTAHDISDTIRNFMKVKQYLRSLAPYTNSCR